MTDSQSYFVGLVQMAVSDDVESNLERAVQWVDQAAHDGAQVVCLPELFRSRYFCQHEDTEAFNLAETIPGPSTEAMAEAAQKHRVTVVVPLFEKRAAGLYHNSLVVIGPDGRSIGHYRKMHIPDDPAYYEKFYFAPGDLGFKAHQTPVGKIGTLICWDQWYPEAARLTALQGAEILFYPTAIGWHPDEKKTFGTEQREAWRTVQRGHAIANGTYVAAVNRIGHEKPSADEPGIEFWGSSFLSDPFGNVLAEGSVDREEVLIGEVDPQRVETVRRNWPFLRDRRVDAYEDLNQRYLDGSA
ncbi:MAG: carbon-nitrogen hydrolase [Phycisphaeraceae bacterium]|nr:carbon-nitrogen hydrolase [Phycisphaeraceae bacterium]